MVTDEMRPFYDDNKVNSTQSKVTGQAGTLNGTRNFDLKLKSYASPDHSANVCVLYVI